MKTFSAIVIALLSALSIHAQGVPDDTPPAKDSIRSLYFNVKAPGEGGDTRTLGDMQAFHTHDYNVLHLHAGDRLRLDIYPKICAPVITLTLPDGGKVADYSTTALGDPSDIYLDTVLGSDGDCTLSIGCDKDAVEAGSSISVNMYIIPQSLREIPSSSASVDEKMYFLAQHGKAGFKAVLADRTSFQGSEKTLAYASRFQFFPGAKYSFGSYRSGSFNSLTVGFAHDKSGTFYGQILAYETTEAEATKAYDAAWTQLSTFHDSRFSPDPEKSSKGYDRAEQYVGVVTPDGYKTRYLLIQFHDAAGRYSTMFRYYPPQVEF